MKRLETNVYYYLRFKAWSNFIDARTRIIGFVYMHASGRLSYHFHLRYLMLNCAFWHTEKRMVKFIMNTCRNKPP